MSLSYLHTDGHKQVVTHIRESRWFESIYILHGKPDQRVTHIPRSIHVWLQIIRISRDQRITTFRKVINSDGQSHCSWKKASQPNPQHDGWPIRRSIPSFSSKTTIEAVGVKLPFVDGRLSGLPGSYLRHAIDTFNTCSQSPTHQSLIDTGGGYNLEGVGFPHHTTWHSQLTVLRFSPKCSIRSQVI
jgi:hypothetical protein